MTDEQRIDKLTEIVEALDQAVERPAVRANHLVTVRRLLTELHS